jgi:uncharacterized protein
MVAMSRTSRRVRFPGGNGFELAGILDHPAARPFDAVAVFTHCFTCNKDLKAIVRLSRNLAENGVAVLRYDLTGLGDSDGDFSQTNFSTNLADLAAAVEFAGNEIGPVTTLIGHSFGGIASLVSAATRSTSTQNTSTQSSLTINSLTINSLTINADLKCVVSLAAPSDTLHLATLLVRMNPAIESEGDGDVTIGGRTWRIRRQMIDDFRSQSIPEIIPQVALPVLILHSPTDETLSFDHAIRLATLLQGGQGSASLVRLDGADHLLVNNPSDLSYVGAMMTAFIKRFG